MIDNDGTIQIRDDNNSMTWVSIDKFEIKKNKEDFDEEKIKRLDHSNMLCSKNTEKLNEIITWINKHE